MDKLKKEIIMNNLILLDMEDVMKITGWSQNIVQRTFAYDEDFPAIKKGKKYQVELNALKSYFSTRRMNK